MSKVICYLRTLKELDIVWMSLWKFGSIYIAHHYIEQDSYVKDDKIYEPLLCYECGHISLAWRKF